VQCLVEFEKIIINLDFCLAHAYLFIGVHESPKVDFSSAMEKKGNTILITIIQKETSTLIKVKKLIYNREITSIAPP
jgi:hypothetical protein